MKLPINIKWTHIKKETINNLIMSIKKVSIIIPCYNESKTIVRLVNALNNKIKIKKQVILVDDYSTDGSRNLIKSKL